MRRALLSFITSLVLVSAAGGAYALEQPDGTDIPTTDSLQNIFNARGEAINSWNDAKTVPETFAPGCALTFSVIARNAAYKNSFGWYNVTGQKPANGQLHPFLTCNDGVGAVKTLDIRNDPAYLGGEIGFYQATGGGCPTPASHEHIFYSQKGYNPDGNQANPFIHLLIYNSTKTERAFYFGWEDLLEDNDNDFDDFVTFVSGITCSGGGGACDTGKLGACSHGTMQCRNGALVCVDQVTPQTEKCDGFDNDCNDQIDEGDLCQMGYVCDRGECVGKCSSAEFPCPPGKACSPAGTCVDETCVGVNCEAGTKCIGGACQGPCDGVVCPHGDVCQLGVCLDACKAVMCDEAQVCQLGICVDRCQCTGCDMGNACRDDGYCVPAACAAVNCGPNTHCDATGNCVDDCATAACPVGQVCEAGHCIDFVDSSTTANTSAATGLTAPTSTTASGGTSTSGSGGGGGALDGDSGGCGCRVAGTSRNDARWAVLAVLGCAAWIRRRRAN